MSASGSPAIRVSRVFPAPAGNPDRLEEERRLVACLTEDANAVAGRVRHRDLRRVLTGASAGF